MNTNTESQNDTIDGHIAEVSTALVTFNPTQYAMTALEPFKVKLAAAKRAAKKADYDITTKEGLKEAKGLAKSFREIRTGIENARKEAKGPILEAGKKVDAVAKELTDEVAPHEAKYADEIVAEEARIEAEKQRKLAEERARIEAIESRIAHIRNLSAQLAQADSATLSAKIEELATKRLEPAMYDDHLEEAVNALNTTVDALRVLHEAALAREAEAKRIAEERAELARLKAEQEAREKAEREAEAERQRLARAEQERVEAERRAAADREAALMRQLEEMKSQMAAQLAAANPPPAAEPTPEPEPETVRYSPTPEGTQIIGIDLSPMGEAVIATHNLAAVQEPMRVENPPIRPSDNDLIELVMHEYGESRKTSLDWLASINFAAAYDKLA